jgi:hypothetical protein
MMTVIKYFIFGGIIGVTGAALKVPGRFVAFVMIALFVAQIFDFFERREK